MITNKEQVQFALTRLSENQDWELQIVVDEMWDSPSADPWGDIMKVYARKGAFSKVIMNVQHWLDLQSFLLTIDHPHLYDHQFNTIIHKWKGVEWHLTWEKDVDFTLFFLVEKLICVMRHI